MPRRPPPKAGRSAKAEYVRLMAARRESSRKSLPIRLAVIAAVSVGVGMLAGQLLEGFGIEGLGWVLSLMVAVSLTKPMLDDRIRIKAWQKGSVGEEKTERWLEKLPSDFKVLHDLAIPGSKANIDHLVIGPTGIFVVDSKNYRGKITENRAGELWSGKYPMARAFETLNWEATKVAEALGGIAVNAILCVHGAELPRRNAVKNGVKLAGPRGTLRIVQGRRTKLLPQEIEKVTESARNRLEAR